MICCKINCIVYSFILVMREQLNDTNNLSVLSLKKTLVYIPIDLKAAPQWYWVVACFKDVWI